MPSQASEKVQRHWSKSVRDVTIAHDGLQVRVEGGAENGEFLYVGAITSDQIKYRKGKLRLGDILIEMNNEAVVGLTLQDLMNSINKAGKKLNFKVVQPGGGITKDIRDFLGKEFPSSSEVDLDLQDAIRDNLYARTVPCTTRPPRSREEPGIDYIFLSKEKFLEMEENGDFLESGTYNGHYYGTMKPALNMNWKEKPSGIDENGASPSLRGVNEEKTDKVETAINGNVTVHREKKLLNNNENDEEKRVDTLSAYDVNDNKSTEQKNSQEKDTVVNNESEEDNSQLESESHVINV